MQNLKKLIEEVWEDRNLLANHEYTTAIETVIQGLDKGEMRVAEPIGHRWHTHEWIKKAVILYFPIRQMEEIKTGPFVFHDKMKLKTDYKKTGVRVVPHAIARYGAYLAKGVIMMPSYVNIGAYVDEGTMVDTWATVGSCAQIGKHCHLSGGVGIGGVLEPVQAGPVVIEDNCFIGARSEVVEGVIVREGSVLGMGVYLGTSTKIVDRDSGKIMYGEVPSYSVVVSGTLPGKTLRNGDPGPNLYCAVIVKRCLLYTSQSPRDR